MELVVKAAVLAVIVIIIAGAGFLIFQKALSSPLTKAQAVQYILSDVKAKNPNANITIVSVTNSTNNTGKQQSWNIVLSVAYNATRPCPTLEIQEYDYPAFQVGAGTDQINIYSTGGPNDCRIIGTSGAGSYVISSPLIAIAQTYISNNSGIRDYVSKFGYNNTYVTAKFVANNSTALGAGNVWQVKYSAGGANYSEYAIVDQSGIIINNYTVGNS
jgi:hypothetical protein